MANEVAITVVGRDQGARQTMQGAQQQATGLGRSVQRVGEIAQGIIAAQMFQQIGQAADRFLGQARTASSDLGESINAVNVTFKNSAAGIHQLGETAADSMGLSQNAFNAASVRFSAFAGAVAGDGGDVTKVIGDITQRSSDFASVMNLDVNEAMQTFQSGLAGESEPLRRYGIDVSAAAVQTFAYAEGIAQAGEELTEGQKVQARYGLIMEQTAGMAGDFANTSDSLANSQRILNAELENAQATVGNLMVPALAALNAVLIPVVQAFSDAPQPIQLVIGSLVLLGAGILAVTSRITPMIIAMSAAGVSMTTLAAKARVLTASLGPVAVVFAALSFAVVKGVQEFQAADVSAAKLAEDLRRLADTGRETGVVTELMSRDLQHFGSTLEAVAADAQSNWADRNFIWSPDKRKEVNQAVEDVGALDEALAQIAESGGDGEAALLAYADANGLTAEQVDQLRQFLPLFAEAQQRATETTRDAAAATDSQVDSLKSLADELRAQTDPMFAFTKAQNDLRDAQKAVTQAEEDHGRKSPEYRDALRGEAEAAIAVLDAAGELGDEFTGDLSAAQKTMLRDAGISDAAIRRLEKDLRDAKREADRLDGTRVRLTTIELRQVQHQNVFLAPVGSRRQAMAHGGIVGAQGGGPRSGMTLVGEQGPELVDLAPGSMVHTAGATQAMLAGAGGGMGRDRHLALLERGLVRLGEVTDEEWAELRRIGWQGRAGDRMEALYPPLDQAGREFVRLGDVTSQEWEALKAAGWRGKAGDKMEALYPPMDELARAFSDAASTLNESRLGPRGKRTWDFYTSGGQSFAKIFATGETIALGRMHEDQAFEHLQRIGKLDQGANGAMLGGSGGGPVLVQVQVLLDGREVRSRTRETILELNRTDPSFRSALVGDRR